MQGRYHRMKASRGIMHAIVDEGFVRVSFLKRSADRSADRNLVQPSNIAICAA